MHQRTDPEETVPSLWHDPFRFRSNASIRPETSFRSGRTKLSIRSYPEQA